MNSGSPVAAEAIDSIQMLGIEDTLAWSQSADGLVIQMPARRSRDHACTFKISLKRGSLT